MNLLRSSTAVVALCLSVAAFASDIMPAGDPESLGFSPERLNRIGSWYQARIDTGALPGAVVAIARNGKLAYLQALGHQDHDKKIAMKPDAIFWIASMTKPVTSVAIMMLAEEGKLDIAAPVHQYLPEFKNMLVGQEASDPVAGQSELLLEPQKRPMTVQDLLRHTSGLVYAELGNTPVHKLYRGVLHGDESLAEFITQVTKLPLVHQPGEVWEYSMSADVLGRIVEVVSGQPFDQFLQSRIFMPLRMVDTGFYVPQAKLARLVEPPTGGWPRMFDVTRQRKLLSGGGGLVSTTPDYLRFCQMLLNGGELDGFRILAPKTVQLMTANSLPPNIRFAGPLASLVGPGTGSSWGLGFSIRTEAGRNPLPGSVGSFGWSGVWGAYFWVDPQEKLVAMQMIQVPSADVPQYARPFRYLTYAALTHPAN